MFTYRFDLPKRFENRLANILVVQAERPPRRRRRRRAEEVVHPGDVGVGRLSHSHWRLLSVTLPRRRAEKNDVARAREEGWRTHLALSGGWAKAPRAGRA